MTDQPPLPATAPAPEPPPAVSAAMCGEATYDQTPNQAQSGPLADAQKLADERPEVAVGAAFAGGLVLAMIFKRLGR